MDKDRPRTREDRAKARERARQLEVENAQLQEQLAAANAAWQKKVEEMQAQIARLEEETAALRRAAATPTILAAPAPGSALFMQGRGTLAATAAAPATGAAATARRNTVYLPPKATTEQYEHAVRANNIRSTRFPGHLEQCVNQLRTKRRLPSEARKVLQKLNAGTARDNPVGFDLLETLYDFDLPEDQRTPQIDREIQLLAELPSLFEQLITFQIQCMSEAAWARQVYSRVIGVPFVTAIQPFNKKLPTENLWYMFRSDTNWVPGIFRTGNSMIVDDGLTIVDEESGQVLMLKPDDLLSSKFVLHGHVIHDTWCLVEQKCGPEDYSDTNKLRLEGCATLVGRSLYWKGYDGDPNLQWVPLVYCAGHNIQVSLMWDAPGNTLAGGATQQFNDRPIISSNTTDWFDLTKYRDLPCLVHLMFNLADTVCGQIDQAMASGFDRDQAMQFAHLSDRASRSQSKRNRSGEGSGEGDGPNQSGQANSKKAKTTQAGHSTTTTSTHAYTAVCDEAMAKLGADSYNPWLSRVGMIFCTFDKNEFERLLNKLPVAIVQYHTPQCRETFLKLFDPQRYHTADIEAEVTIHTKLANAPEARVPSILHHMTIQAGRREFTVLEIENAGDTHYVAKSFEKFRSVMRQTLQAFEHIHSLGIVHCDMKSEHIAVRRCTDDSVQVSIIDWGMAVQLDSPESTFYPSFAGTDGFNAPEMRSDNVACTSAVDIYSLGCAFSEFVARSAAVERHRYCKAYQELMMLLQQMCAADARSRPSAHEALQHPFFSTELPSSAP